MIYFYICRNQTKPIMKKELGKWLMDIAKYLMTAAILSSIIADMGKTWYYFCC